MIKKIKELSLYIGLFIALAGALGSLYFSEIMGLTPCVLCWYQRIALYPLVIIFSVGIIKKTYEAWSYAISLIVAGLVIGFYQLLLVYGLIKESSTTCSFGVSCAKVDWTLFGFINIPLLAFLAFIVLLILYFVNKKSK